MPIARNTVSANSNAEINIAGNFVYLIDSTGDLGIILDDQNEEFLTKSTGYKTKDGNPFKRINLVNNTASPITFNLQVGNIKDFIDNRAVINGVVSIENASNDFAHARGIAVGNTATLIRANTPTQSSVEIQNEGTSTLYIGRDATVTTSTGYPVPANTAKKYDGSQAIYGIRASLTENVAYFSELVV